MSFKYKYRLTFQQHYKKTSFNHFRLLIINSAYQKSIIHAFLFLFIENIIIFASLGF